jgi:hypothetical protein
LPASANPPDSKYRTHGAGLRHRGQGNRDRENPDKVGDEQGSDHSVHHQSTVERGSLSTLALATQRAFPNSSDDAALCLTALLQPVREKACDGGFGRQFENLIRWGAQSEAIAVSGATENARVRVALFELGPGLCECFVARAVSSYFQPTITALGNKVRRLPMTFLAGSSTRSTHPRGFELRGAQFPSMIVFDLFDFVITQRRNVEHRGNLVLPAERAQLVEEILIGGEGKHGAKGAGSRVSWWRRP